MSPILVRPVREQLEHDRIIRLLQARSRRKYDAGINPGAQQNVPVSSGETLLFPDVVLTSLDRGRKVEAVIEVETGESVNHLEALAQWAHLARLRPAFHLYVPSNMVDVARQLCDDNNIVVGEIWSFHGIGDDIRFTLVHRSRELATPKRRPAPVAAVPVRRAARATAPSRSTPSKPTPPKKAVAKHVARKTSTRPAQAKSTRVSKPARPVKGARSAKVALRAKTVLKKKPAKKPTKAQKRK